MRHVAAILILTFQVASCGAEPPSVPTPTRLGSDDATGEDLRTEGFEVAPGNEACPFGGTQIVTYRDQDGSLSYDENIDVTVSIEYQCRDGNSGGTDSDGDGTIDLPSDGNAAPRAFTGGALTGPNTPVSVPLSGEDDDGSVASYRIVKAPANGSATIVNQSASYTPIPGFTGKDQFTFAVIDDKGKQSAEAVVNVLVGGKALFVADFNAQHPRDVLARSLMEEMGLTVSIVDDDDSVLEQGPTGMDLVFVSETVQSGSIGTKLNGLTVPAIVWDGLVCRSMLLSDPGEILRVPDQTDVAVRAEAHPALGGFKGTLTVSTMPALLGYFNTVKDAVVLTSLAGDSTKPTAFMVDGGKTNWNGGIVPARRICMPWFTYSSSDATFTAQGKALFKAMSHYAAAP